jgi:hypothetical protein
VIVLFLVPGQGNYFASHAPGFGTLQSMQIKFVP